MENKFFQRFIKRLADIVISLIMLITFFPIFLLIAIIIKLTSEGPIFFLQDRPGIHKRIFRIYKFRTMKINSEQMVNGQEVMRNDDRITTFGRFLRRSKLDELIQLLNVLKGEMSLIGPRPERISSLPNYSNEISKRLSVRPGMTGLAQVNGNIYLTLEERYRLDVYYVEHYSLLLDICIAIRTVGVVLFGEEKFISKNLIIQDDTQKDIST